MSEKVLDSMRVKVGAMDDTYVNNPKSVAGQFSASKAYAAGDYVYYNRKLYCFTAAHAAGAWTGSDASEATVSGELTAIKADLTQIESALNISISGTIDGETGNYKYLRYTDGKTYEYLYESYVFTFSVDGISAFDYLFTTTPGLMGLAFYNSSGTFISGSGVQAIATKQTVTVPSGAVTCKATVMSENDVSATFNAESVLANIATIANDVGAMNTATTEDEGKALKVKTVTNGKVTEWEFGDASSADSSLENKVFGVAGTIDGSAGNYKYVHYLDGKVYSYANESYVYTFAIGALTSFAYLFTMASPNVLGLAFYNESGTFISGSGVQAGTTAQTISVPSNAVTCKATVLSKNDIEVNYSFQQTIEAISDLNIGLKTTVHTDYSGLTPTTGYYVDYRDGKVSANANMQYIQFPINGGSYIQYNSTISSPDIRGLAFYNDYGSFVAGYKMLSTTQKIPIPTDATLCKVTVNSADDVYLILTPDDIAKYADKKETFDILPAFDNITCVGDSLTWSQVYLAGGSTRKAHRPWVGILEERTGATTEEIANPGYSASQWWAAKASAIVAKTNQLAIVYLGTNMGLSDTVGTDCIGDDPTNWGNTLTADYCRIVKAFKTVGAQVILVKPFTTTGNSTAGTSYAQTSAAIDSIATRFGCGVVEPIYLADSAYHKYPDGNGTNAVHYNDLGYAAFVDKLITAIAHMKNEFMVNIVPE